MSLTVHAALEIGTTRTVMAIGECESGGEIEITSIAKIPSTGIRKSVITDIDDAATGIKALLKQIENESKKQGGSIDIANAFLVVNGQHISADQLSSTLSIAGKKVSDEDIEEISANARQLAPQGGERQALDIIEQDFSVDQTGGILSPKGRAGHVLRLNVLSITGDKNKIQDAKTAADAARLELRDPLFACTCAAEAVLEDHEKKSGVLVLDLGGGSTGYAFYCDGYLVTAGAIGVGGDHITNDLAHAFGISNAQAELLKRRYAAAVMNPEDGEKRATIEVTTPGMDNRTVSMRAVNTVTSVRMKELIAMIRERLESMGLMNRMHTGVVLTGGGAQLRDVDVLIQRELGAGVRIGRPLYVRGLESEDFPAEYAAIAGALMYAHRNYEEHSIFDSLKGIFK